MVSNIVLSATQGGTLASINRAQRTIDDITLRLASGLRVNSAIDDPNNFFASQALRNTASDFTRLLDGIGQSIRTIEQASIGVQQTARFLDQAETLALESQRLLADGGVDPAVSELEIEVTPPPINERILGLDPVLYYRLDETSGTTAVNLGTGGAAIDGTYQSGVTLGAPALFDNGSSGSAQFDGVNDHVFVPNSTLINVGAQAQRTVELVFNADTTAGRQVLYEEGAGVNGLTIYVDDGLIRISAEDDGNFADIDINASIEAGQTYHVAFVFDQFDNSFTGYLDGVEIGSVGVGNQIFPSHSGAIGLGRASGGVQFHDGEVGGNGFNFQGQISDVAVYNDALSEAELLKHTESLNSRTITRFINEDYNNAIDQIDQIAQDANYRGINLLGGDDLITQFNSNNTSELITKGVNFTTQGFGLIRHDFNDAVDLDLIIERIRDAQDLVRNYGRTLSNNLAIIATRQDFTQNFVNTHLAGADDLTLADANKEGADLLATQTRLALATTALSLATESQQSVLRLF